MSARVQGSLIKAAHPSEKMRAKRLLSGIYRIDDCGDLEKRCSKCEDYWPADSEFFFSAGKAGEAINTGTSL